MSKKLMKDIEERPSLIYNHQTKERLLLDLNPLLKEKLARKTVKRWVEQADYAVQSSLEGKKSKKGPMVQQFSCESDI